VRTGCREKVESRKKLGKGTANRNFFSREGGGTKNQTAGCKGGSRARGKKHRGGGGGERPLRNKKKRLSFRRVDQKNGRGTQLIGKEIKMPDNQRDQNGKREGTSKGLGVAGGSRRGECEKPEKQERKFKKLLN